MRRRNRVHLPLIALALATMVFVAGCGPMIGWFVNAFAPPQKVRALYEPPADKKLLVFVDDMLNPVSYEPVKGELTKRLNRQLTEHKVVAQTVTYEEILDLMAATPNFNELTVTEIGQKLKADVVVYVYIDEFTLKESEASPLWRGRMRATVRVVDVELGRLWPEDRPTGHSVKPVETPGASHPSPTYGTDLSKILAEKMAERIAKLFYTHRVGARQAAEQGDRI